MKSLKRVCVYCGSSPGVQPRFSEITSKLGKELVKRKLDLVYGGGGLGLMGVIARTVLKKGGKVTGIIPKSIVSQTDHLDLSELIVVNSMHERKAKMFELSDAFIALPGGFGTLEEILEIVTWAQLGNHDKAVGFLNIEGFYDGLFEFLKYATTLKFIKERHLSMIINESDPCILLDALHSFQGSG